MEKGTSVHAVPGGQAEVGKQVEYTGIDRKMTDEIREMTDLNRVTLAMEIRSARQIIIASADSKFTRGRYSPFRSSE